MTNPAAAPVPAPSAAPCIILIAALASNRVIGANNDLPWRLPEDLRHFKALTLGHPIVMGRKTWDSLGRPLPGRSNLVISRQTQQLEGAQVFADLAGALAAAARAPGGEAIYVIGGAEIFAQALPLAQRLELTEIACDFAGDCWFPELAPEQWQEVARDTRQSEQGYAYAFVRYERYRASAQ